MKVVETAGIRTKQVESESSKGVPKKRNYLMSSEIPEEKRLMSVQVASLPYCLACRSDSASYVFGKGNEM